MHNEKAVSQEIEHIKAEAILAMTTTARAKTWEAVHAIKNMLKPGITEKAAIKNANEYLRDQGVKKFWHKTHIRFGQSTILSFNDPYTEDVVLKSDDIFYIDIGPIWDGIEGDCGATFVLGNNKAYIKIKDDVKIIFDEVLSHWQKSNLTGKQLFEYAHTLSDKMGYKMHPSYVKGHRLSEFSHALYSNIGIFDLDFKPLTERWILELQVCDPSLKFGAFYEDILM